MTGEQNIASLGVAGLSHAYETGALTPVDVFAAYKRRIDAFNSKLNAFLNVRLEQAAKEAEASSIRWREGRPLSSIDGIPFGAKANIAVDGLPWHGGIGAYRDRIASEDAACIGRLRAAGAIPLGILNMHEGALGATTDNEHFGRCANPWGQNLTPGGSSGGSGAAVAAGLCAFSLGTDTMGSVRIPSAYCGIAGLKPSFSAVPEGGLIELSSTLDHIGPHALRAEDLTPVLEVLSGSTLKDAPTETRVGIARWGDAVEVEASIAEGFRQACDLIKSIGVVKDIDISGFSFGALRRRGLLVSEIEGYAAHSAALKKNPEGFSDTFRGLLLWGADQPKGKIEGAYGALREAADQFDALFEYVDVIVVPTAPQGPFPFGAEVPANQADFTCIANFAGAPAVAVPATSDGAPPASIQFIARKGADQIALAAAVDFEKARGAAAKAPGYF